MKTLLIIFFGTILSLSSFSKENKTKLSIGEIETELNRLFVDLRKKGNTNTDYTTINKAFKLKLKEALKLDEAFDYGFDSLFTMSKITSPDGKFRLFNWNVELESGVNTFHCFILRKDGNIIELRDKYRTILNPESKSLNNRNWYGACYYEIIPMKGGKYTLLGWNGKDEITTQKVIETMSLSRKSVKFGYYLFEFPNSKIKKKRIILEYSSQAVVSLKYYSIDKVDQIVFSHLSPSTPQMKGFYQYYYPDLSLDKFVLNRKGKWVFESDTKMNNPESEQDDNYNKPE